MPTDARGALDRVIEALAGASEEEVAALMTAVRPPRPRRLVPSASSRTPVPVPASGEGIRSEVEWV